MDIYLTNTLRVEGHYTGTSKYQLWVELVAGDILTLSIKLNGYSDRVTVHNKCTGSNFISTRGTINSYLKKVKHSLYDI